MMKTTQPTAKVSIEAAAERIRQALDTWNAADLYSIEAAQQFLESAVADLKLATEWLSCNPNVKPAELRRMAAGLRKDLARMSQIVDACIAFQNGLSVRLTGSAITYDPSGAVPATANRGVGVEV